MTTGPVSGTLLIAGGGRLSDAIIDRFIELAGGADARIVVVPTAAGEESYDDSAGDLFRSRGAVSVTVLHTADRDTADSRFFTRPLEEATGVWFGGGRQWRLVDSYKGTLTGEMFRRVLDRGGVIGGLNHGGLRPHRCGVHPVADDGRKLRAVRRAHGADRLQAVQVEVNELRPRDREHRVPRGIERGVMDRRHREGTEVKQVLRLHR